MKKRDFLWTAILVTGLVFPGAARGGQRDGESLRKGMVAGIKEKASGSVPPGVSGS
jgi:hypothetical protein